MNDLISRQKAINALENTDCELSSTQWDELTDAIMQLPSEHEKGKWKFDNRYAYIVRFFCSQCHESYNVDTFMGKPMWNYCPNCGADMRKEAE